MIGTSSDTSIFSDGTDGWDVRLSHDETSITIERKGERIRLSLAEAEDLAQSMMGILRQDGSDAWSGYWTEALR